MSNKNLPYISDHTLNKDEPEAIIYYDADGNLIFLTEADFSSREEYEYWKKWSDDNYEESERSNRKYNAHKLPLFDQDCPSQSAENEYFGYYDRSDDEEMNERLLVLFLRMLTAVQRRRFLLYYGEKMTLEKIAELEGTHFTSVSESIEAIEKKFQKFKCKLSVKTPLKLFAFPVLGERGKTPFANLDNFIDSVKGTKPA